MTTSDQVQAEWQELHADKAAALNDFNEAKFGMFIHWGLYAIPGGIWKGQKMEEDGIGPRVAEWIMRRRSIPRNEYAQLAKQFNPVKFDADEWARIAADAGMKYLVITSKHHDGFALYNSAASDYNMVAATPFRRDVVDELHTACTAHAVRFGLYYSHTLDWYDGGNLGAQYPDKLKRPWTNDWDPSPRSFDDYLEHKSLAQVEELVKRYPDLFLVWFDGAGHIPEEVSMAFYRLIARHAPRTLVSSRLSNDDLPFNLGDFESAGDNHIPDPEDITSSYWETCGTMNNSWGYNSYDHDWKYPVEVLSWLVDVVSRGGNYLLNVGPDGYGEIPAESVKILREVGKWMQVNGEAIYGTTAWTTFREGPTEVKREGTLERMRDGFTATFTPQDIWFTRKGNIVYAIGLAFPEDNQVTIRTLAEAAIESVQMLGCEDAVSWETTAAGLRVSLPRRTCDIGFALAIQMR